MLSFVCVAYFYQATGGYDFFWLYQKSITFLQSLIKGRLAD